MSGLLVLHTQAFVARLRTNANLTVYPRDEGDIKLVPTGATPPYVAVQSMGDRPLGPSLAMHSNRMRVRFYCHCVGLTDLAARQVSDEVADTILDVKLSIPGRECFPVRHETDHQRGPEVDESIGRLVSTLTDIYRLESVVGFSGS